MNGRESLAFARLENALRMLRGSVRRYHAPAAVERLLEKLEASVKRLYYLQQQQAMVAPLHGQQAEHTERLRKRLRREYMIPLTRLGRRLFRFNPAVEKTLKVPHARASHREVITTAELMLKAVRPHRQLLESEGFPKTFLADFRDLTRELKLRTTTSSARQMKFAQVSRTLREELASANQTLRILDGLVLGLADHDRGFAELWKNALRTPKPLGRPPKKKQKRLPNELSSPGSPESPLTA